jgi:hypothetical protein
MTRISLALLLAMVASISSAQSNLGSSSASQSSQPGFVGDPACTSCHREQSLPYLHTSHHRTSQHASRESILGSFQPPSNLLTIADPMKSPGEAGLSFKMEATQKGFTETAIAGWPPQLEIRTEPIDIVTGSGKRGQTYLYWHGDQLFELPVSYWTKGHQWINSPGYIDGTADFSRPVNPGCLECHATYIKALSPDPRTNHYDRQSFVPGISCENCHGPGAQHIALQQSHPIPSSSKQDQMILNPATFSRDRQIDLCAQCHNGIQREEIAPAFSYVPGRPLSDYFKPIPSANVEHPDVHGNQVGLLERSRCFLSSPNMTCSTCHEVHAVEQSAASYSSKCLTCHQWQSCPVSKKLGHTIVSNCIDCHMPVEPTNVIVSETADKEVRATMRNHWIKVYPAAHRPDHP